MTPRFSCYCAAICFEQCMQPTEQGPSSRNTEHGFWRAPSHFRLNPSTPLRTAAAFPPTPPPQRSSSAKAHRGCWRRETDRPPQHSTALRGAARTYLPRTASPTAQPAGPQHHSSGGKRNLRPPLQRGDGQRSAFLAGPRVFPPGPQWRSTGRKRRAGRARRRLHGDDGAAEEAAGSKNNTREVQGNRLYLTACKEQVRVEGISKHKKEMKITAYCTFEEETANNKNVEMSLFLCKSSS
ncbi:uncharacterized protein DCDC1 isoform X1 [Gallus gallus]|uniref:uncharacterized protein DCDC1 isoform X1 n=1 Tax=Gallus gallus TaxID=9031 RepID=UPI001EFF9E9E|nr:uncharacterized protein DCDC1 isoform X1 [Gallus gallus]